MYIAFIAIYMVVVAGIGIFVSRKKHSSQSFLSADKALPWYVNAGTLIATYVGSGAVVGYAALAFKSGYNAIWMAVGGWAAILLHVLFYNKIVHMSGSTVSELIGARYGEKARMISAVIIIVAETSVVGYNIKSTGWILSIVTGMNESTAAIVATAFIIFITLVAGLVSVAYTDYVQAIVIIVSFIVGIPFLLNTSGGFDNIRSLLPAEHFQVFESFNLTSVLSASLPTLCIVFMSQGFWQRFAASRSKRDLKKSVLVWLVAVIIITLLIITFAVIGSALLPNAVPDTIVMSVAKELLPPVIGLFVLAGTTSILVTTADSYLLAAESVFQTDIYNRYIGKNASEKQKLLVCRLGVVVLGLAAYVLVTFFPSILSMIYFAYTMEGGLIVVMLGIMFWKRATPQGGLASVITVLVVTIAWEILKPYGIPTIFATLVTGTIALVVVSLMTPPPDPKYLERFQFEKKD